VSELGAVWIGMAEISIGKNCELELKGAGSFVWCATQAQDADGCVRKIEHMLTYYGLHLIELQGISRFNDFDNPSDELVEIVERAAENPDFAIYGTFHEYPHHTA
jgi:hypothetical protein